MACVLRLCRPKYSNDEEYWGDEDVDQAGRDLDDSLEDEADGSPGARTAARPVPLVPPWTTGRLVVEVLGANHLAAVDENGFSDPFVTVRLGVPGSGASLPKPHDRKYRTATVHECLSPRYKQERFVYDDVRAPLPEVRFEVYDWSPGLMGREKATPLGTCTVSLAAHWKASGGDATDAAPQAERVLPAFALF